MAKARPPRKGPDGKTVTIPSRRKLTLHDLPYEIKSEILSYIIPSKFWFAPHYQVFDELPRKSGDRTRPLGLTINDPVRDCTKIDLQVFRLDSHLRAIALDYVHHNVQLIIHHQLMHAHFAKNLKLMDMGFGGRLFSNLREVTVQVITYGDRVTIEEGVYEGFEFIYKGDTWLQLNDVKALMFGMFERVATYQQQLLQLTDSKTVQSESESDSNNPSPPQKVLTLVPEQSNYGNDYSTMDRRLETILPDSIISITDDRSHLNLQIMLVRPKGFWAILPDYPDFKRDYFLALQEEYVREVVVDPFARKYGWAVEGSFVDEELVAQLEGEDEGGEGEDGSSEE